MHNADCFLSTVSACTGRLSCAAWRFPPCWIPWTLVLCCLEVPSLLDSLDACPVLPGGSLPAGFPGRLSCAAWRFPPCWIPWTLVLCCLEVPSLWTLVLCCLEVPSLLDSLDACPVLPGGSLPAGFPGRLSCAAWRFPPCWIPWTLVLCCLEVPSLLDSLDACPVLPGGSLPAGFPGRLSCAAWRFPPCWIPAWEALMYWPHRSVKPMWDEECMSLATAESPGTHLGSVNNSLPCWKCDWIRLLRFWDSQSLKMIYPKKEPRNKHKRQTKKGYSEPSVIRTPLSTHPFLAIRISEKSG